MVLVCEWNYFICSPFYLFHELLVVLAKNVGKLEFLEEVSNFLVVGQWQLNLKGNKHFNQVLHAADFHDIIWYWMGHDLVNWLSLAVSQSN